MPTGIAVLKIYHCTVFYLVSRLNKVKEIQFDLVLFYTRSGCYENDESRNNSVQIENA